MSFVTAAIITATAINVGVGINQMVQGRKKRIAGENKEKMARMRQKLLDFENEQKQKQQQKEMEILAGQSMSETANMQARYDEMAREGLPEEIKEQYLENIQGSQAQTLNAMANRRGGLIGATQVDQNAVDSYKDLLAMDAQQQISNERAAMQFQGQSIGQLDALRNRGLGFGIENQRANYARDLSRAYSDEDYGMALQGEGEQMVYDGMAGISSSLMDTASAFYGFQGTDMDNNMAQNREQKMVLKNRPEKIGTPKQIGSGFGSDGGIINSDVNFNTYQTTQGGFGGFGGAKGGFGSDGGIINSGVNFNRPYTGGFD